MSVLEPSGDLAELLALALATAVRGDEEGGLLLLRQIPDDELVAALELLRQWREARDG